MSHKSYSAIITSPLGLLGISLDNDYVIGINFLKSPAKSQKPHQPLAKEAAKQLQNYFINANFKFDLPLNPAGTEFQKRVWQVLLNIPLGITQSYGTVAKKLQSGARAVGNACRCNPISIIIPCHRVVAANHIGGYSGFTSGEKINVKQWLLQHEKN